MCIDSTIVIYRVLMVPLFSKTHATISDTYTNLTKVFVSHKITLVVNVPIRTNIQSGAMMGIEIFEYRGHTVFALTLVKI